MVPIPHSAFCTLLHFRMLLYLCVYVYVSNPQRIFVYVYAYTCVCILWSPWPILLCAPLSWETLVGAEMDLGAF